MRTHFGKLAGLVWPMTFFLPWPPIFLLRPRLLNIFFGIDLSQIAKLRCEDPCSLLLAFAKVVGFRVAGRRCSARS